MDLVWVAELILAPETGAVTNDSDSATENSDSEATPAQGVGVAQAQSSAIFEYAIPD
jgi:hypothetical protein